MIVLLLVVAVVAIVGWSITLRQLIKANAALARQNVNAAETIAASATLVDQLYTAHTEREQAELALRAANAVLDGLVLIVRRDHDEKAHYSARELSVLHLGAMLAGESERPTTTLYSARVPGWGHFVVEIAATRQLPYLDGPRATLANDLPHVPTGEGAADLPDPQRGGVQYVVSRHAQATEEPEQCGTRSPTPVRFPGESPQPPWPLWCELDHGHDGRHAASAGPWAHWSWNDDGQGAYHSTPKVDR